MKAGARHVVNQAHLGEIKDMMDALTAVQKREQIADWELLSITEWFHAHKKWITYSENLNLEVLYPIYETRFHYPKVLKYGHKEISKFLEQISFYLDSWKAGDEIDILVDMWTRYSTKVNSIVELLNRMHFQLVHAYFTRAEIAEVVGSLVSDRNCCLGPMVYYQGKDKFRQDVMKKQILDDVHWRKYLCFLVDNTHFYVTFYRC